MNEQPLATCDAHDSVRQIEPLVLRLLNGTVRSLKLTVRDDGLVLRGHTRTYYAKQLAQHAVMQLTNYASGRMKLKWPRSLRTVQASDDRNR